MGGLSISLPLSQDSEDGLKLNKTYQDVVKQNLKNLILTVPGERIMMPDFGVGLKTYLFEQDESSLRSEISSKIHSQVNKYLPFVNILNIVFNSNDNFLSLKIFYNIVPLDSLGNINITIEDDEIVVV